MMRPVVVLGLALGASAVLAVGIWLGSQRPRNAANDIDEPATPVERAATPHDRGEARAARGARPALHKPATPGLDRDLRDPDPLVRRNAIAELAASGNADAKTLLDASRDPDLGVAIAATEGLGSLYRDGRISARELVARVEAGAPAKVRVTAINGLGQVASSDSAHALIALLARGSDVDRRSAAIVLVHQDPALAVPALIDALADSDVNVRANARESLRALARGRDLGDDPAAWRQWWQARS